jgi:hypothetical protein
MQTLKVIYNLLKDPKTVDIIEGLIKNRRTRKVLEATTSLLEVVIVLLPILKTARDRGMDVVAALKPEERTHRTNGQARARRGSQRSLTAGGGA